ncbi:hypothetical protein C8N25_11026 [Algoriphagus antarcticus]|uniref:Uncharacterized protein n=2 Tax=Algoriphagus antarcticus TaxID=238540 RepID=A0A3E0DUI7_9BACT|nr:hypothetical protein C8N25_11026 [Algoriphagus antarcticus]
MFFEIVFIDSNSCNVLKACGMKKNLILLLILVLFKFQLYAQWNPETADWVKKPSPQIGDWGFDRPGYPKGLYIQGVTVKEGNSVKNPVIYDNDIVDDVLDDEWAFLMASLGKMNLKGYICTPVLTDGWGFYNPEWKKEFYEMYGRALRSGISKTRIPKVTIGTEANSEKEGENKLSEGAKLYVSIINEQYAKNPNQPVIVNIGGQAATLASAWILDKGISEKCIVYYTAISQYNGHYKWASELVAQHFRVINFGPELTWWRDTDCQNEWEVLPRPDQCGDKDRNERNSGEWALLPDNELMNYFVHQLQYMPWYDATNKKDAHNFGNTSDGYFDGTFIHAWSPGLFTGAKLYDTRKGKVLYITAFDPKEAKKATFPVLIDKKAFAH